MKKEQRRSMFRVRNAWYGVLLAMVSATAGAQAKSDSDVQLQVCEALANGGLSQLRAVLHGKPIHIFNPCTDFSEDGNPAIAAIENLPIAQWPQLLALVPAADRARLNDMRLGTLLRIAPNQLHRTGILTESARLQALGAVPRYHDGTLYWLGVSRLLDALSLDKDPARNADNEQVVRIFTRLLPRMPADANADLSSLWSGIVDLPEPQRSEALRTLKAKFGGFTPSRDAWQQEPDANYPLRSADAAVAISKDAPIDVVLALMDLRAPAPPEMRVWDTAIENGRLDVLDSMIQRRYAVPLQRRSGIWLSPFLSAAQAAIKGDTRALERMIAMSPQPLFPEDVNQRMKIVLFSQMDRIPDSQMYKFPENQLRYINDQLNTMSSPISPVDIGARDSHGYSLLVRAAVYGDLPLTKSLLDAGADPNAESPEGMTALAYARCYGHPDIAQLLLQRKAANQTGNCHY